MFLLNIILHFFLHCLWVFVHMLTHVESVCVQVCVLLSSVNSTILLDSFHI